MTAALVKLDVAPDRRLAWLPMSEANDIKVLYYIKENGTNSMSALPLIDRSTSLKHSWNHH